eukprot:5017395-Prymnesium_polylepis.1
MTAAFSTVRHEYHVISGTRRPSAPHDDPHFWHGQVGQDFVVSQVLREHRVGFFVDLAANVPIYNSNTRALERDFGWTGLCIDGNEALMPALTAHRSCTAVAAIMGTGRRRPNGEEEVASMVVDPSKPGLGKPMFGERCADCKSNVATLGHILDSFRAPRVIDYLSLDTYPDTQEEVLLRFPHHRFTVHVMTIEGRPSPKAEATLRSAGYVFALELGWFREQLWLHERLPGGLLEGLR